MPFPWSNDPEIRGSTKNGATNHKTNRTGNAVTNWIFELIIIISFLDTSLKMGADKKSNHKKTKTTWRVGSVSHSHHWYQGSCLAPLMTLKRIPSYPAYNTTHRIKTSCPWIWVMQKRRPYRMFLAKSKLNRRRHLAKTLMLMPTHLSLGSLTLPTHKQR